MKLHHAELEHGSKLVGPTRDDPVEVLLPELGEDADQACCWELGEVFFFVIIVLGVSFGRLATEHLILMASKRRSLALPLHLSIPFFSYRIQARGAWREPWSDGRRRSIPCLFLVWLKRREIDETAAAEGSEFFEGSKLS